MAVLARPTRFERAPIRAAQARRRRFPGYFEMDSAVLFMVGVTMLALTFLLYLLQTSRVAVLGYEIQQVQAQQAQAARTAANLNNAIGVRSSLPEVERYARTKLNMKPVTAYKYVRVRVSPQELGAFRAPDGGQR